MTDLGLYRPSLYLAGRCEHQEGTMRCVAASEVVTVTTIDATVYGELKAYHRWCSAHVPADATIVPDPDSAVA